MKTHDKDHTNNNFAEQADKFFNKPIVTALNTSIGAQEGNGIVNQSPPPSLSDTALEILHQAKDEVARKHRFKDWEDVVLQFQAKNYVDEVGLLAMERIAEPLKEALHEIRGHTYARDTDDVILHAIKETLTEAGFPYESED